MSKRFKLVDATVASTSQQAAHTNWELCVICQEQTTESLTSPAHSKRQDIGRGYKSLAANLVKFNELGKLPRTLQLERIDEGQGIEAAMVANEAKWHHTCMLRYNNTMLRRAEKRTHPNHEDTRSDDDVSHKRSRLRPSSTEANASKASCFFCGQSAGTDGLHEASTFQIDRRVRESAALLGDTLLLARLSMGDMVALEAKYHAKCLLALYNRARKVKTDAQQGTDRERELSGIVVAELVMYIEEARSETSTAPVFKLADLAHLYMSRMKQLGVVSDTRVNTTRLKQRLLAHFPDLRAHTKGRDVVLVFDEDIGAALGKACEQDSDSDAVQLARAAQIVRRHV